MKKIVQRSYHSWEEIKKILNHVRDITGIDPYVDFDLVSDANTEDAIKNQTADIFVIGIGDNCNLASQFDDAANWVKAGKPVIITHGDPSPPEDDGKCTRCQYCLITEAEHCENYKTHASKLERLADIAIDDVLGEDYIYYSSVNVINDHPVLHSPHDVSAISNIQKTHSVGIQFASKVGVVLRKSGVVHLGIDGKLAFYNIGHNDGDSGDTFHRPDDDECKLFVNLLYYLTQ